MNSVTRKRMTNATQAVRDGSHAITIIVMTCFCWRGSTPRLRICIRSVWIQKLGQATLKVTYPNYLRELTLPLLYNRTEHSVKETHVTYIILGFAFMIALGIVLADYELKRTKRQRCEELRQRARRCVRRGN